MPHCFVIGTMIWTETGPVPIERIGVGASVLARSENGDHLDCKPVLATFMRHTHMLVELTFDNGRARDRARLTGSHRLFAKRRGWVEASMLEPGRDILIDSEGRDVILLDSDLLAVEETVYNFEVADFHTYFVGKLGFWAHNCCGR
jgi:hypothetical protein